MSHHNPPIDVTHAPTPPSCWTIFILSEKRKFSFFFSQFSAQFYLEVDCVSCRTVFPAPPSSTMSARKLCSHAIKSSNSSFLRRKYFSSSKAFDARPLLSQQPTSNHTVNYSQALGSLTKDQAHDLVFRLNDEERIILMRTLEQFHVSQEKDGLECKCDCCCPLFRSPPLAPLINLMNVSAVDTQISPSSLLLSPKTLPERWWNEKNENIKIFLHEIEKLAKTTFLNVATANKTIFSIPASSLSIFPMFLWLLPLCVCRFIAFTSNSSLFTFLLPINSSRYVTQKRVQTVDCVCF